MDEVLHPAFNSTPYWWDERTAEEERRDPEGAWDVAVIGAGYAGLSAALELGRNGASVAVLDSGAVGSGASTRNSGAVSVRFDLPKVMRSLRRIPEVVRLSRVKD